MEDDKPDDTPMTEAGALEAYRGAGELFITQRPLLALAISVVAGALLMRKLLGPASK